MQEDPVVIVGAKRTPMGSFQGIFSSLSAPELGAAAIRGAVADAGITAQSVEEVVMGLCLFAGVKQAPARQAAHYAGLDWGAGATTLSKMCGSGMKTTMVAHDSLIAGSALITVAGGMESMTNAPYLLSKARAGYRLGHGDAVTDHMFLDGLEDAYEGKLMGIYAQQCADHYGFSREEQDQFAIESLKRAKRANEDGSFKDEIESVTVKTRRGESIESRDEQPFRSNIEKIPHLKPAFGKTGTVTAANSSSISDGGAALVLMRQSTAEKQGLTPRARILGHASFAHEPDWFTTSPVHAIGKLLEKLGWSSQDPDLYEINEAFAVVTMAAMRELDLPHEKVNIHGGACALGHPVGASGTRIIITLLNALEQKQLDRGVAGICIGGGEATAIAIERLN